MRIEFQILTDPLLGHFTASLASRPVCVTELFTLKTQTAVVDHLSFGTATIASVSSGDPAVINRGGGVTAEVAANRVVLSQPVTLFLATLDQLEAAGT